MIDKAGAWQDTVLDCGLVRLARWMLFDSNLLPQSDTSFLLSATSTSKIV